MEDIIKLASQLVSSSERSRVVEQFAHAINVESLLILVKDEELNILLPARGFPQTIARHQDWQSFADECIARTRHKSILAGVGGTKKVVATGVAYKDEAVIILLGGTPRSESLRQLETVMPMLVAVLRSEQRQIRAEARLSTTEGSLIENREIVHKLDGVRRELQAALRRTEQEVSARIRTEGVLRASQEQLRFMAESMPQKVFTTKPDGEIEYLNPQWTEYTGMSADVISQSDWSDIIHPDDLSDGTAKWQKSLKDGKPLQVEHRLRRRDGVYRQHLTRAHAQRNANGEIILWVGSSTDIDDTQRTRLRKDELEKVNAILRQQRKQLIALNKTKDEFISLASHQLRTPATGVKQYVGMVLEGFAGDITPQQRNFLERAEESNERQLRIVNDLLKVARIDSGKVLLDCQPTDIVAVVQSIIDEQAAQFEAREQRIVFSHDIASATVTIDAEKMRMALENLIDNAGKYTHQGKQITITVRQKSEHVVIVIKDEGVGIAQQDMKQLFQKFSRIHNDLSVAAGGTGIGLYWSRKVIDLHSGTIAVASVLGVGTTFTVTLPNEPPSATL